MSAPRGIMKAVELRAWLTARLSGIVRVDPGEVVGDRPFADYGLSSRESVGLVGELEDLLGVELEPTLFFRLPTLDAVVAHFSGATDAHGPKVAAASPTAAAAPWDPRGRDPGAAPAHEPLAVVGLGCRLPGAPSPRSFQRLLLQGRDAVGPLPEGRRGDTTAPRAGAFLERVDLFDPHFFAISPREASFMDPQQRLLLEVVSEALADGGLPTDSLRGSRTGVFIGLTSNDYARLVTAAGVSDPHAATGSAGSIAANRLSYVFDWRGPSVTVDTGCSSSLVALHWAARAIRAGDCDAAVVAGVQLNLSPEVGDALAPGGLLAADGRSKPFAAAADGFGRGEGCSAVFVKPLSAARREGDRIHGLVLGTAVNQDGRSNGLTAPNGDAQAELVRAAWAAAGAEPAAAAFFEANATGTDLGDRIEAEALGAALAGRAADPVLLGSVKGNFGNLEAAAGVTALLKAVLALRDRRLPPSVPATEPNAGIDFTALGLSLARRVQELPRGPLLAGVSSFGFGGTNAHAVVASTPADAAEPREADPGPGAEATPHAIPLSAHHPEALVQLAGEVAVALRAGGTEPADLTAWARGAALRRDHLPFRLAVVAADAGELAALLETFADGRQMPGVAVGRAASTGVVFLFSADAGDAATDPTPELSAEPAFRSAHRAAQQAWAQAGGGEADPEVRARGEIFALQVGLAALWRSWGVEPAACLGPGVGEASAGHVSGALDLPAAARRALEIAGDGPGEEGEDNWAAIIDEAVTRGAATFVEIGPRPAESVAVHRHLAATGTEAVVVPSLDPAVPVRVGLLRSLVEMWVGGCEVDWRAVIGDPQGGRSGAWESLPPVPWQHRRYWFDEAPGGAGTETDGAEVAVLRRDLPTLDSDEAEHRLRDELARRLAAVLGMPMQMIEPEQPVSGLGLNSLAALELVQGVEAELGLELPVTALLGGASLGTLAAELATRVPSAASENTAGRPAQSPAGDDASTPDGRDDTRSLPVSLGQEGLWAQHQVAPDPSLFNVAIAWSIDSPLRVGAFAACWRDLARRHPQLRATFHLLEGEPRQHIADDAPLPLTFEAAEAWDSGELARALDEAAHRPFDLQAGPLFRLHLFRRGEGRHLFLLTAHHLVVDLASLGILFAELGALYAGRLQGRRLALPPLAADYHDYVMEQRALLEGSEGSRLWSHWHRRLAGADLGLRVDVAAPPPERPDPKAGIEAFLVDGRVSGGLGELAQRQGVTLSTLLLTAFLVLLHRAGAGTDITVSTPSASRRRPELAPLVGYLANLLVLRADLSGNPRFGELLQRVQDEVLAALDHDAYPLPALLQRLSRAQGEPLAETPPAFTLHTTTRQRLARGVGAPEGAIHDDLLTLANAPLETTLGGLVMRSYPVRPRTSRHPLVLHMVSAGGMLSGSFQYQTARLGAAAARRLAVRFQSLLATLASRPDLRLAELVATVDGVDDRRQERHRRAADGLRGARYRRREDRTPQSQLDTVS